MTLARPLLLLALAALPILWWLARRAAARKDQPVSSLLLWRRVGLTPEPPRESRRRADLLLWLRMAAAAAVALGMAGPVVRGASEPPTLHVLLDTSASMSAFEEGVNRALEEVESRSGRATVEVHRREGIDDLAAILATAGDGDVVVVTDHRPEGIESRGRIRLVLVGEPVQNVGFAAVHVTEKEEFFAVVTNYGTEERSVEVVSGGERIPLSIPAGESRVATGKAPRAAATLELEPGDRFAFDDRITAALRRPVPRPVTWRGPREPHTALALSLAGFTIGRGPEEVVYREPADARTKVLVAPPGRTRAVDGSIVTGPGMDPSAAPARDAVLGPVAILEPGGDVLLADRTGPLAIRRGRDRIEVAMDPGHGGSTWPADPSFPIFWAEATRLLTRDPDDGAPAGTTLDRRESATRGESAPPDLDDLTPSAPPPPGERDLTRWLLLLGAVLLAAHVWLEHRQTK